jgi:hypothetical protein
MDEISGNNSAELLDDGSIEIELAYHDGDQPVLKTKRQTETSSNSRTFRMRWLRSSEQFPRFDKCHSTGFEGCGNFMRRPRRVAG